MNTKGTTSPHNGSATSGCQPPAPGIADNIGDIEYEGWARTNFFKVTDRTKFQTWAEAHSLTIQEEPGTERVALISPTGPWPGSDWSPFFHSIVPYLAENQVAVFRSIEHRGDDEVTGMALAINWQRKWKVIHLDHIYSVAKVLGENIDGMDWLELRNDPQPEPRLPDQQEQSAEVMEQKHISTRSNFFRVKNIDEFKEWASRFGFEVTVAQGMVAISHEKTDPSIGEQVGGKWVPLDLQDALQAHLDAESVAVVYEADEKASYGTGRGFALNAKGHYVEVAMDDIFQKAEELGTVDWNVP